MKTYKILVAEDDPALLHSFRIRLLSEGYEVLCAQDAHQAVALAGEHAPDMLILDIHMPGGNGFSARDRILKLPNVGFIPIIYVTGDPEQDLTKTDDVGIRVLLRKPFNTQELLRVVRDALERSVPDVVALRPGSRYQVW